MYNVTGSCDQNHVGLKTRSCQRLQLRADRCARFVCVEVVCNASDVEPASWRPGYSQNITIHNTQNFTIIIQHKNAPDETSFHAHNHVQAGDVEAEFDTALYHFTDESGNILRLSDGSCYVQIGENATTIVV